MHQGRARTIALALTALAGAAAACSGEAFTGASTPSDAGTDSGTNTNEAAAADAALDAAAPPDAEAGTFCSGTSGATTWCMDFDGKDPFYGWTIGTDRNGGAAPAVVSTTSTSPPASMLSSVPASAGVVRSYITRDFAQPPKHVHVAMKIDAPCQRVTADGATFIFFTISERVATDAGTRYGGIDVGFKLGKAWVLVNRYPTSELDYHQYELSWPTASTGAFQHVEVDVDLDPVNGRITGRVDDNASLDTMTVPTSSGNNPMFVNVGVYAQASSACDVHYDDVRIDWSN